LLEAASHSHIVGRGCSGGNTRRAYTRGCRGVNARGARMRRRCRGARGCGPLS
jgi:hypothetical protein